MDATLSLMDGNTRRTAELAVAVAAQLADPGNYDLPAPADDFEVKLEVADPYPDRLAIHARWGGHHAIAFVSDGVGPRDRHAHVRADGEPYSVFAGTWDGLADEVADRLALHASRED
jgi:hypothetical protein